MRTLVVAVMLLAALGLPAATIAAPGMSGGSFDPGSRPAMTGEPAKTLRQAVAVLTRDDHGRRFPAARWPGPQVAVTVTGPEVSPAALDGIDRVLAWLTATSGVDFHRVTDVHAPMVVELAAGLPPRGVSEIVGHRIVAARVQWDPTVAHARRWAWEELLQVTGPGGDWGPAGSLCSTDQTATGPSAFDTWLLGVLYRLPAADLDAARLPDALRRQLP